MGQRHIPCVCLLSVKSDFAITKSQAFVYLRFAEARGHQASWAHIQVPLLPSLVVRVQSWYPAIQGADDHERPAHRAQRFQLVSLRDVLPSVGCRFNGTTSHVWRIVQRWCRCLRSSAPVLESAWPSAAASSTPVPCQTASCQLAAEACWGQDQNPGLLKPELTSHMWTYSYE